MATLASDWPRHIWLLLWNRWTEFNETRQEARPQRPLPSLCLSGRSEKRWPPWPLIGRGILDFSSETAERNSTKLDRKQDINVLYQVCVFRADRKNKMATLASDWPRHFRLLLWNHWTELKETWQEARSQRPLPSLYFFGPISKQICPPPQKGGTLYSFARYVALWASCLKWPFYRCTLYLGWISRFISFVCSVELRGTSFVCSVQLGETRSKRQFQNKKILVHSAIRTHNSLITRQTSYPSPRLFENETFKVNVVIPVIITIHCTCLSPLNKSSMCLINSACSVIHSVL